MPRIAQEIWMAFYGAICRDAKFCVSTTERYEPSPANRRDAPWHVSTDVTPHIQMNIQKARQIPPTGFKFMLISISLLGSEQIALCDFHELSNLVCSILQFHPNAVHHNLLLTKIQLMLQRYLMFGLPLGER